MKQEVKCIDFTVKVKLLKHKQVTSILRLLKDKDTLVTSLMNMQGNIMDLISLVSDNEELLSELLNIIVEFPDDITDEDLWTNDIAKIFTHVAEVNGDNFLELFQTIMGLIENPVANEPQPLDQSTTPS